MGRDAGVRSVAAEMLHPKASATFGDMRDDGASSVQPRHTGLRYGEGQFNDGAWFQTEVVGVQKGAVCAQITGRAELPRSAHRFDIDLNATGVAWMKATIPHDGSSVSRVGR